MKQHAYARKRRQLKSIVKKLNSTTDHPTMLKERLLQKAQRLLKELTGFLSRKEWQRSLAALGLVMGISATSQAQSFGPTQDLPFGLDSAYYLALPTFGDLDGDGDFDLLIGEYYGDIIYYENTGTANAPQFATGISRPFGIDTSSTAYIAKPELVDMDGDGDLDLLIGTAAPYGGSLLHYQENIGTAASPAFGPKQVNKFGINDSTLFLLPTAADLDGDGDYDILAGSYYGALMYYENTGSATNPVLAPAVVNPFGTDSSYIIAAPALADLDEDGDLDLLVGTYDYGKWRYFENTGDAQNPQFAPAVNNPFGIQQAYYYGFPAFADLDGDGDMDLLYGEYYGNMVYQENTTDIGLDEQQLFEVNVWPNPAHDHLMLATAEPLTTVEILDVKGQMLFSQSDPGQRIELLDLPPGQYLLKITNQERQSVIRKFSKTE